MIKIRKSADRGRGDYDWLDSAYTFSFSEYHDPAHMRFGKLRVINEDVVAPGKGFARHPHRDMEIITYVIEGELAHADSLGTGSVIRPGEIQRMTAGSGVEHSEFNHSSTNPVHLLQIWIFPEKPNLTPSYQQIQIQKKPNELILIGSRDASDSAVTIHQDVKLYVSYLAPQKTLTYTLPPKRMAWLQLIKGNLTLNGEHLQPGDGAAIDDTSITITADKQAEFLLFDLEKGMNDAASH